MLFDRKFVAAAVISLSALLSSCSSPSSSTSASAAAKPAQKDHSRKPAPDFALTDATGHTVKLSDYHGKVVLLNFWATWCGPCTLEIPWFVEFQQQFRSQGFEVLGVSMDEDGWQAIKPYIAEHKMNYRVVLGNDSVSQLYGGVDSLPTTFMIDRDGNIAFSPHVGLAEKNEYLGEIQKLLSQNGSAAVRAPGNNLPALLFPGAAK